MRIIKTAIFILFTILICSNRAQAQNSLFDIKDLSSINIDNYSDNELLSFYNKALSSGIPASQMYKLVADKGLPASEVNKLKDRLGVILAFQNKQTTRESSEDTSANVSHGYDTTGKKVPLQQFKNDETIFGSELFTSNSMVFEPNLRIPAPAGYVLGPDDELLISIYGYSEKQYHLNINEEGEIYIPNVGPLMISGLTIEQARDKITSKLAATIYKAINTGKTKVQITLGKIRSIRVTVIGQAKKPGTYTVSSLTTLYNILYLCGGPTSMGSYRNIEIIRGKQVRKTADLYDFLVNGDNKDNILLQEGDVIRIPYYNNRVTLSGSVKREGKFEMLDNETVNNLLEYSGGFTDNAYRGTVTLIRLTDTARTIIDVQKSQYNTFKTIGSDEYIVGKLRDEYGNRIVISGAINRPGPYELIKGLTLNSLVEKAGGFTRDAYVKRISIFRYFKNKMPTIISVNMDSLSGVEANVALIKDDSIAVHSIFEFNDNSYVSIEGNVRKPGPVPWRENMSLRDLLLAAGGVSEFGDSSTIEITRRIRNADVDEAVHNESKIFNVNLASDDEHSQDILLQPYDIVIIKSLPGYSPQRTVLVLGEIMSPGRYGLQKSSDKISDLIQRAGRFKASADSSSITIRRRIQSNLTIAEREQLFQRILNIDPDSLSLHPRLKDELYKSYDLINVDLHDALANTNNSENLVLNDGDVLTISKRTNLVKISGEVYNPTIIPYKPNKSLKYYIAQAGNFTPYARKNGSLVIYPDGKAASVKHFLFFKSYPSVTPRSEIFVPQRSKINGKGISVGELALVVSALAIISNVIINIP